VKLIQLSNPEKLY